MRFFSCGFDYSMVDGWIKLGLKVHQDGVNGCIKGGLTAYQVTNHASCNAFNDCGLLYFKIGVYAIVREILKNLF